jgi:hypothetical protein
MLIDLITYTHLSPSGTLSADALISRALSVGLNGICITDREHTRNATEWQALSAQSGLFIAVGVELLCEEGLLIGLPPCIDDTLTLERWRSLTHLGRPRAQAAIDYFNEIGGATILGPLFDRRQPLRLGDLAFTLHGPTAIDVACPSRQPLEDDLALEAALALDLTGVGASRALTHLDDIGKAATAFLHPISSQQALVASLHAGSAWAVRLRDPQDPPPRRDPQDPPPRRDPPSPRRDDRSDSRRRDDRQDRRRDERGRAQDPETEQPTRRRRQFMLD